MSFDLLANWIGDFAATAGFEPEFDENGVCCMELEGGLLFSVARSEVNPDLFVIVAPVAALTLDETADRLIMEKAMQLNLFQLKTAGGSLALGPVLGAINFILVYPIASANSEIFYNVMQSFLTAAKRLQSELIPPRDTNAPLPGYALRA